MYLLLRYTIVGIFLICFSGISSIFAETLFDREVTYYADEFQGRMTANGEQYLHENFSMAICDLPLSRYYHISWGGTGVVVRANDRPNCRKNPQAVDVSQKAFSVFSSLQKGRIPGVQITSLGDTVADESKSFVPRSFFQKLGVLLENDIPTLLFSGEAYLISGRVTGDIDYVMIGFSHEDDTSELRIFPQKVREDKTFDSILEVPDKPGIYHLIVINANQGFQTNTIAKISVLEKSRLSYPVLPISRYKINPLPRMLGRTMGIVLPENISATLTLSQGNKKYVTSGRVITFRNVPLSLGHAEVQMSGYDLSTPSPLDRGGFVENMFSGTVILDRKHENIGTANISSRVRNSIANIRFKVPSYGKIASTYYITFPNGSVNKYTFPVEHTDGKGFLIPEKDISLRFPMSSEGVYLFELLNEDGTAYVNTPLYRGKVWSVIDVLTNKQITTISVDREKAIQDVLNRLNALRLAQKKSALTLDPYLSQIAQAKVDDFIKRNYTPAHRDIDGNYIGDFAKKRGYTLSPPYAENIASGYISHLALQDGLEESGSHRYAMFSDDFTKVGIGYSVNKGKVYLLQLFGD